MSLVAGVTHIVYCEDLDVDENIKVAEKDIIQLFDNPRGNVRGKRKIPLPQEKILQISKDTYNEFVQRAKTTDPYVI
jgi:hypothetical protein